MAIRFSTGLRNAMAGIMGIQGALLHGAIEIWSGSQPASADNAMSGTKLGIVTSASLTRTVEVPATGSVQITGSSGTISTVTVNGFNIIPDGTVPYNTSTAQTAQDLCDAINRNGIMLATVSGSTVTIMGRPGQGDKLNSATVAGSTSLTVTNTNMSGGTSPVNGLRFANPVAGKLTKPSPALQIWGFYGIANGVANSFRFIGSIADAGNSVNAAPWPVRMDGTVGSSGADMGLTNVNVAIGAPNTIDKFDVTIPGA